MMYYENLKPGSIIQYEDDPNRVLLILSQIDEEEYNALIVGTNSVIKIESVTRKLVYA